MVPRVVAARQFEISNSMTSSKNSPLFNWLFELNWFPADNDDPAPTFTHWQKGGTLLFITIPSTFDPKSKADVEKQVRERCKVQKSGQVEADNVAAVGRIVADYRSGDQFEAAAGAWVLVHGFRVLGISKGPPDASKSIPGVWAVDSAGKCFIARGGHPTGGAEEWMPVN